MMLPQYKVALVCNCTTKHVMLHQGNLSRPEGDGRKHIKNTQLERGLILF